MLQKFHPTWIKLSTMWRRKLSPEGSVWPRPFGLEPLRLQTLLAAGPIQRAIGWGFWGFLGPVLQPCCWAFMCPCVSVCASAFIRGCGGALKQVGFQCQETACFSERVEFSLAPLPTALSVFILKMCFQSTISWNPLAAAGYEIPSCKSREEVSCQGEVYKRVGHPEECQLRSCQEVEKKPETRTLHRKGSRLSSGWKLMFKNFNLNSQTNFL